jgi:hypothetical protein
MLVPREHVRFVDEWGAGPNQAIEDIDISATGERQARIKGLVEASQLEYKGPAQHHVAARSEDSRAGWVQGIPSQTGPMIAKLGQASPISPVELENDLSPLSWLVSQYPHRKR